MQHGFAIDGTLSLLLLVLLIALAALAAIWAIRRSRTSRRAAATPPLRDTAEGSTDMQRAPSSAPLASADPVPIGSATDGELAPRPLPPRAERLLSEPQSAPAVALAPASMDDLAAAIARAGAGGDKSELAHLYIKQAAAYIASDKREDAAASLRDAIRVAALNRLAEPHALARLELGDLYLSNGDPITACEQWQIARNLFHDLSRPADRDGVDKRMLGNGCPTDWVLTDF